VPEEDDLVFRALADSTRRFLLDLLFERGGRTLSELESQVDMSRFGVMKHLRVLEQAGLVVTRRAGREKLHYLNPVPIRLIHDRWINKYTEHHASALVDLKFALERATTSDPSAEGGESHGGAGEDRSRIPDLHQGDAGGDLGGDHHA
jgi:DNA-binding transcriptional ArsR family regulator